jgi:Fe-S oxidoreductase
MSAEVKLVPVPAKKGLGLIFFDSITEAMQASVELQDLKPAAIEHMDRILLDETRDQRAFQGGRDLLELNQKPCEALLAVEFFDDVEDRLAALENMKLGSRRRTIRSLAEANLVWGLRKAGLSLLTGRKGDAKPISGIEDAAVLPRQLPEYVRELQRLMQRVDLEASYYGHAGAGLLHVRPILNLHWTAEVRKFRQLANEVSALVRQFKGSLAAEHGVGIARTEFLTEQIGETLLGVMRQIKDSFDPHHLFNPGKVVPDGRFAIDEDLRIKPSRELSLPFTPMLAFAAKDDSFVRNLEQCNGCGGCRKLTPTMCPTFLATGDEIMSTRGRANTIRAVLDGRCAADHNGDVLASPFLEAALSNCLACKACTSECPSNVNLALLKTELLHARIQHDGLSWRQRLFCSVDTLGRFGCRFPWLANKSLDSLMVRSFLAKAFGIAWQRPLPHYARQRFDRWFARHRAGTLASRGAVILWDDTFVRYHEPQIGIAAVRVLEAAGFEVTLVKGRKCCGRPAFSQGHLERAWQLGRHNLDILLRQQENVPILFLEPSCYSMFVEDYRELGLEGADLVAARCYLFEQFIEALLSREPEALAFQPKSAKVIIHAHCHLKSLMSPAFLAGLAERLPERTVHLLSTGCCGMAGGFGAMKDKYELSLKVAEPLMREVRNQPYGTVVVASGTSCRHQIAHLAPVHPRHMAEVLSEALA